MNAKAWLVIGGFLLLAYVAATSGHHSSDAAPAPVATYIPPAVTYTAPPPPPEPTTYTVQPGDGLKAIADAHGVTLGALLQANGFADSNVSIRPKQVLQLPSGSQPAPTATTYATTYPTSTTHPTAYPTNAPLPVPTYASPTYQPTPQPAVGVLPSPTVWARTCPNGSCYGQISPTTGQAKTQYVAPYVRKDGTVVGGHYRTPR